MIPWRELVEALSADRVKTDLSTRWALASDASFYHLLPQAVVQPDSEAEIQKLLQFSHQYRIPLTFRTAGTSLSGQAVTDGILVDLSRHWRQMEILANGTQVRVQPGVTGGAVNARLRPLGRKIGPDPASIEACMLGGILANNASGMCCGVRHNAYHTLVSMRLILANGRIYDSSQPQEARRFRQESPALAEGLLALQAEIRSNPRLEARIREKYQRKNTTGYSLNALLDFEEPLEILTHLMIGSEGTLGFISEATLATLTDAPCKYTGLLIFATIQAACQAIPTLESSGAAALELMDRASLRAISETPGFAWLNQLPAEACALLAEYQASDRDSLQAVIAEAQSCLTRLPLLRPAEWTTDPARQNQLWKLRKGLFPAVGAVRAQGTTVLIEDLAFPLPQLAAAVTELQQLFSKHGYHEAIIFGHAKDGNLHFVITQSFNSPAQTARYQAFMDDLVALTVGRFDGALKAEHGTGRNMAPFVETEWGPEAYALMVRLKALLDPYGVLNPGVILNPDPQAHLRHLKTLPAVDTEIDHCIECGFCEKQCPSRDLSLTPRQRIVLQRAMARLEAAGAAAERQQLEDSYHWAALETCATDGLCALACPVSIDTGHYVKRLRESGHSRAAEQTALYLAQQFPRLEKALALGLQVGHLGHHWLGAKRINQLLAQTLGRWSKLPTWPPEWPTPRAWKAPAPAPNPQAVYFVSCITRQLGYPNQPALPDVLLELAQRAGITLEVVSSGQCCGLPFSSKGFRQAGAHLLNQSLERLWHASKAGTLPILVDNSPCTWQLLSSEELRNPDSQARMKQLRIMDSVAFCAETLLPALKPHRLPGQAVVHPVCSLQKMGLENHLQQIVAACTEQAEIPASAGCCGFAGDRGYLVPALTAAATAAETAEIAQGHYQYFCSSSRTCELGLERASGQAWQSYLYLLEAATRPLQGA